MICTLKCASWQAGERLCCQGPASLGGHCSTAYAASRESQQFPGLWQQQQQQQQHRSGEVMKCLCYAHVGPRVQGCVQVWPARKDDDEFSRGSAGWLGTACPGRRGWGCCACSAGEAGILGDSSSLSTPLGKIHYGKEPGSSQCCMPMGINWNNRSWEQL